VAEQPKSFQETLRELWALLTSYARQETVGPFRSLGTRIGLGIGGSLLVALGWFLVVLGVVRLLQTHELPGTGTWFMHHDYSIYGIAVLLLSLGLALIFFRARRRDPALPPVRPATPSAPGGGTTTTTTTTTPATSARS
jgi:hypothetical protein